MYAKVCNYLRGSVLCQCESPAPERVLNLCGVYGIPFWDVQWETAERFTLRTTRQGAAALEDAAADIRMTAAPLDGLAELAKTYDALYTAAKRQRGMMDFNDLEHNALAALALLAVFLLAKADGTVKEETKSEA